MEQILSQYNKSVGDVARMRKKIKKIREGQPVKERKPTYEVGEDGWTKVNNTRKSNPKKKKQKEQDYYYAFEVKEAKLQKHKELLAKFEEDKKKLQKMREQRKFKI